MPDENLREMAAALLAKAEMGYGAMLAMRGDATQLGPIIGSTPNRR
ncbi:MAG: hypothetical protein PVH29_04410 [Candidatus Zixiibacteriota bacterium]|jgi:hypothetical protein